MRILIALRQERWGGLTSRAFALSEALCRLGHQVLRAGGWLEAPPGRQDPTLQICPAAVRAGGGWLKQALSPTRAHLQLKRQLLPLRQVQADCVIASNFHLANIIGKLVPAAPLILAPPATVLGFERFEARYRPRYSLATEAMFWCQRRQTAALERKAFCRADAIVVESQAARRMVLETYSLGEDRVRVIPTGVDCDRFAPNGSARGAVRDRYGIAPGALVAAFSGRLEREKNVSFLLYAVALAGWADLHCMIIGDGGCRPGLQSLAKELGLGGRAVFTGFTDQVAEHLAACDVMVLPSASECFGNAMLEAMASGLACVATAGPWDKVRNGAAELIEPGRTGEVVAWDKPEELAALLKCWSRDRALCQAMGSAGRLAALTKHNWERVARAYLGVLQEVEA